MATPEEEAEMVAWLKTYHEERAMRLVLLQEAAGLTLKEAKAIMLEYEEDSEYDLAEELGVTVQAVYNLERRARKKIDACGRTLKEILGKYMLTDRGMVLADE